MLVAFKGLRVGYCISAIAGIVSIMFGGTFFLPDFLAPILALVWVMVCYIIFFVVAQRRFNAIMALREECLTREYIKQLEPLLKNTKNKNIKRVLQLNLFAGYFDLGETERAKELLLSMDTKFPDNANGLMHRSVYYANFFSYYRRTGQLDLAEEMLNVTKAVMQNSKMPPLFAEQIRRHWADRKYELQMERGDFEGAESHFLTVFESESKKLPKVCAAYELVLIYRHFGDGKKAQTFLDYVLSNGKDTYYAAALRDK